MRRQAPLPPNSCEKTLHRQGGESGPSGSADPEGQSSRASATTPTGSPWSASSPASSPASSTETGITGTSTRETLAGTGRHSQLLVVRTPRCLWPHRTCKVTASVRRQDCRCHRGRIRPNLLSVGGPSWRRHLHRPAFQAGSTIAAVVRPAGSNRRPVSACGTRPHARYG